VTQFKQQNILMSNRNGNIENKSYTVQFITAPQIRNVFLHIPIRKTRNATLAPPHDDSANERHNIIVYFETSTLVQFACEFVDQFIFAVHLGIISQSCTEFA